MLGFKDLTFIHDQWIKKAWTSPEHIGMICHRGSYKTTSITIVGMIWWLLFNPDDRVALVRKTSKVADRTLRTIKRSLENPNVAALFQYAHGIAPKTKSDTGSSVVWNFKSKETNEGNIDSYGINTVATGTHYDKILCDDVIAKVDRYSNAEREKTIQDIQEILTNIIDPGKQVIIVGTLWHKEDAWKFIGEAGIKVHKYTPKDVGVLSEEQLQEKRKTTTYSLWMANYFNQLVPDEDSLFGDAVFDPFDIRATPVWAHLDQKFGGKDTMALTLASRRKSDGRIQVRGWVFDKHVKQELTRIRTILRQFRVKKVYCENNNDQNEYIHEKLMERANGVPGINAEAYHESMNKHEKIVTYIPEFWDDIVFDPNTDERYISQIVDYQEGEEPDDAPDSLASLLRMCFFSEVKKRKFDIYNKL